MDDLEMRQLKEELVKELVPMITRQVYLELRAEEILEWLQTNLRDIFYLTPALPGYYYLKDVVFEMLHGTSRIEAITKVAQSRGKTHDNIKSQIYRSIKVANHRIEQIEKDDIGRWLNLKFDKLPPQPQLINMIIDECVKDLKLRIWQL